MCTPQSISGIVSIVQTMKEVDIVCHHIEGRGRRLGFSLSDAGMENIDDEGLNDRINELQNELDFRTLKDGEVVDTVEIDCEA